MEFLLDVIGSILIILGLMVVLTGSFGMLRFKDFFQRLHPAGLVDSFGAPLILIGLMFIDGFTIASFKLAALMILILFTSPTACHALAKAAYHALKQK